MSDETVILYNSPEAARLETGISGWVSRDGHYWGAGPQGEHMARYDGCTHRKCDACGEIIGKSSYCPACHDRKQTEVYKNAPRKKWHELTPIVIQGSDYFFFDVDSLCDYCIEHECQPDDLRLMHCAPIFARQLSTDFFEGELPDDGDVPAELEDAVQAFNAALAAYGKPLSWVEGKEAVEKPTGITVAFERDDEEP